MKVDQLRRRRLFALAVAPVALVGWGEPAGAACFDTNAMPANQKSMRRSLGFKDATDAEKRCGTCAFYATTAADCGKCALLSGGAVAAANVCDSWAAKG